ncbi:tetratricopeptide repeat protein [Streptomyces sp. NPDC050560]|uniref:tetratricopeptide repeat protein n=1 Tax=Streptomyces sp. NPDC050560 TaxID=3365630 RepID=UPI00378CE898
MAGNRISGEGRGDGAARGAPVRSVALARGADGAWPDWLRHPDRWPTAASWDALAAGAHRARTAQDGPPLPSYIPRDADAELRELLTTAAAQGGLVLVVGDSTAGKTRTAHAALRAVLPGHRVLVPPPAGAARLAAAPGAVAACGLSCVVWLDDLEAHLGPGGLEPDVLDAFIRLRVPLLATMRAKQYEAFSAADDDDRAGDPGARVLRRAAVVDLERRWSRPELERADTVDDPRVVDALTHHGPYGVAEYLATGPALLHEWRRARAAGGHARGAALVSTAVDLARTGIYGPHPAELLVRLHERRLAAAGAAPGGAESVEEAFAWATRVRGGVTGLLVPAGEGRYTPFAYLVDHADCELDAWMWQTALELADGRFGMFSVGTRAWRAGEFAVAERAWRAAHEEGVGAATNNLATLLATTGRREEAEALYRRGLESGDTDMVVNYGKLLAETGRAGEAEGLYRRAADDPRARYNLAILLAATGRTGEAEALYRQAHATGNVSATYNLAGLLQNTGRVAEAEVFYRQARDRGHPAAANNLGNLLADAGRLDEAEAVYREAYESGSAAAANNLAILLEEEGRLDEAEALYRQAHRAGSTAATGNLAILLEDTGRFREAAVLRAAPSVAPGGATGPAPLA